MKCIRCNHYSHYRERKPVGGACPECKGEFAFEIKKGGPVTDKTFAKAIWRASSRGGMRFGRSNLYYEVCRSLRTEATVPIGRDEFDALLTRFSEVHGPPEDLIEPPKETAAPRMEALEADIVDYSFDNAVVCDRAETVALLVANNFHFENNCAVLSIDGHPAHSFDTIRNMLRRNPELVVFAVHDASVAGCKLAEQLATDPAWFPDCALVVDVGLQPPQRQWFRGLWRERDDADHNASIDDDEGWLARYDIELAAVRPRQLVRKLFRALRRHRNPDNRVIEPGATHRTALFTFGWQALGDGARPRGQMWEPDLPSDEES